MQYDMQDSTAAGDLLTTYPSWPFAAPALQDVRETVVIGARSQRSPSITATADHDED